MVSLQDARSGFQREQVRRWRTAESAGAESSALARAGGCPEPLARALLRRGVTTAAQADRFLKPRLSDCSDPAALPGMEAAVRRIWRAIEVGESIAVYGDYDVDGVTSAALMSLVLGQLGARVTPYLPHRLEEGYGLSVEALERCLAQARPGLIVTTDCGTGSHAAVAAARAAGVDVVVTDHHESAGAPVEAAAVVNPKLGADGAMRMLAGVGVAFKVCHGLLKHGRAHRIKAASAVDLREYLDLVALGTIADVVPVLEENRILARHGLERLNRTSRAGLRALAEVAGVKGDMGAYHVGFVLGPRINAAGRMGRAEAALELLLTGETARANELAAHLDAANRERKRVEGEIVDAAVAQIERRFDPATHFGIVVGESGWHAGVVGIVAARLAARYGRPAVVVGFDEEGAGRGSCRSAAGFDLVGGLKACEAHLGRFGGHGAAAGLEVHRRDFERFSAAFHEVCRRALVGQDLDPVLELDGWVTLDEVLDQRFAVPLEMMAPFGEGNPEPVWGVCGARVIGAPRVVGERHLKMLVGAGTARCEAIGFGMGEREVPDGALDLAFQLRQNAYQGRVTPQLNLVDFRPSCGSPPS